jgi:tetratricopeptide (TPR) repeat protein
VAANPEHPIPWGTLSDALLELGRTDEAIDAAQHMMDLKPNLPSYSRAAHLQWLRGDLPGARESLRSAIDAGGGSLDREPRAWVIVQAAMIFWNEGDADGALAGFDQALKDLPGFPPALVGKGRVLIGRGDGKAAEPLLAQAYKANPLVETGWLLGDARELSGDAAGAQQIWSEIERKGTADPRTLALFLATKKLETERAVELALAERQTRDDQYTEDVVAWALYRAGRLPEALEASARATKLGTRDARLWYHAGAIRLAGGDASGRKMIEKALALNPAFDRTGAAEARELVAVKKAALERP